MNTIKLHNEEWSLDYIAQVLNRARDGLKFKKENWQPRDALVSKNGIQDTIYTGQEYDKKQFHLVKDRWDHDHCLICNWKFYQSKKQEIIEGYTNGYNWVCIECFEKVLNNKEIMAKLKEHKSNRICPVEKAGTLDTKIRRWLQNPQKILNPYIKEGMTVLDLGCGPGFFSVDIAQMVGSAGKVIAVDLQEGMLQKLRVKIKGTELENRITLHKCKEDKIGISENVDFVLAFYIVHEVVNKEGLFTEIETLLKPNGRVLIVEPPFHVSKRAFEETIGKAKAAGLTEVKRPQVLFNKAVVIKKE